MTMNETRSAASDAVVPIERFRNLTSMALTSIRRIYETIPPTRETLGVLFAVDAAQTNPTEAWIGFFIETASAQLIWDERPSGLLNADDARFVLDRFDDAPRLSVMALLVRLLDEAPRTPVDFAAEVRRRATTMRGAVESSERPASVPYLRLVA